MEVLLAPLDLVKMRIQRFHAQEIPYTIWFVFPASRFPLTLPNCHIHLAHCPPIVSAMPTTSTAPTASAVPLDVLKASICDDYIHTYYARPVRWQQDCAGRQISRKEEMVR